jgi:hypothetical protein
LRVLNRSSRPAFSEPGQMVQARPGSKATRRPNSPGSCQGDCAGLPAPQPWPGAPAIARNEKRISRVVGLARKSGWYHGA